MKLYGKGKLLVELVPAVEEEVIISNETVAGFKEWIGSGYFLHENISR